MFINYCFYLDIIFFICSDLWLLRVYYIEILWIVSDIIKINSIKYFNIYYKCFWKLYYFGWVYKGY